jgi:hypothetical protein
MESAATTYSIMHLCKHKGQSLQVNKLKITGANVITQRLWQAIEEGRGLVIVNKMDLLRDNQTLFNKVMDAVPSEIQTVIPQVIVVFC